MTAIAGLCSGRNEIATHLVEALVLAVGEGAQVVRPAPGVVLVRGAGAGAHRSGDLSIVWDADLVPEPGRTSIPDLGRVISEAWSGGECGAAKLHGGFAYALWDEESARLELAVDRFRIRPLVYGFSNDTFAFGSHLGFFRAIPGFNFEIDPVALLEYLNFTVVPAPRTIFQGFRKLRAAHRLVFDGATDPTPQRYWRLRYMAEPSASVEGFGPWLRETLSDSVSRHAVVNDEERVGAFLSGGLDSSTVVAYLSRLGTCDAFSIGFDDERYNEIDYARLVAGCFGVRHHEYFVTPEDLADSLETVVCHFDEPFGNSSAIAAYFCARLARHAGIDILLAGDGGDELFAGNERYLTDKMFQMYGRLPRLLRRAVLEPIFGRSEVRQWPAVGKVGRYVSRACYPNPERLLSYGLYVDRNRGDVLQPGLLEVLGTARAVDTARSIYQEGEANSELGRLLLFDQQLTLADNDLRKVSETAALAGLRVRYPMLDSAVGNLAALVPAQKLLRRRCLRAFFKDALREVLPIQIINKSKHGFGIPFASWLRTNTRLRELIGDIIGGDNSPLYPYVRREFLDKLCSIHMRETEPYYADLLWPFLTLSIWLRSAKGSV